MANFTKTDLIAAVAQATGHKKKDVEEMVFAVFATIREEAEAGQTVNITGPARPWCPRWSCAPADREGMMTEQEYDEQIAPALAEIARKVSELGGSIVARVEWQEGDPGGGILFMGVDEDSSVAQRLTYFAALCRGNFDQLYISAARSFDLSQTLVGQIVGGHEEMR